MHHSKLSTYRDTLASLTMRWLTISQAHPMGNIKFHSSDISNRLNEKMALCCKPKQTWWSLNRLKEHGVKFGDSAKGSGQLLKSTHKNSWESYLFMYCHKYSGGDGQRAAIPDMANKHDIASKYLLLNYYNGIHKTETLTCCKMKV